MKKIYALAIAAFFLNFTGFSQQHFNGNNNTGFGGVVGPGTLDVSNDADNVYFQFNRGTGNMNDVLVFYIDDASGGFATTANFADVADGLRKAISGYTATDNNSGPGRSTFNFNSDFSPEYAAAFQPGNGTDGSSVLVALQDGASHTFISNPDFTNKNTTSAANYLLTVPIADLGLSGSSISFKFIATYISNTAYRSDEAIGDPMTDFSQGWNNYTSTSSPLEYTTALPVVFGKFYGSFQNKFISLVWDTKTETNTKTYEIQKSSDIDNFITIATLPAKNSSIGASYSYDDNSTIHSKNYYRIAAVDFDGRKTLSTTILVENAVTATAGVKAYFANGIVNVMINNTNSALYQLALYSASGQKITSSSYQHPGGESITTMYVAGGVKGVYYLSVKSGNENQTIKLFAQ